MRPKDLIMDLFGDYIRYMDGDIRLTQLTQLMSLFDVEPPTTRVTLSRMRKEGWVTTERHGRNVSYQASARMLEVLDEGRDRIFTTRTRPWSGQWTMVLYQIPEAQRQQREALKRKLAWEGFGQLNPTTWVAPHDVREKMITSLQREPGVRIHVVTMTTGSWERDRELAQQCWDLADLATKYHEFIADWEPCLETTMQEAITPAEALKLRVKLVWSYRHFPFIDPGLPDALTTAGWPASRAHEVFLQVHHALAGQATAYISSALTRPDVEPGSQNNPR
ncbi:PaaX family transcriptional regulator [Citricoccus sp. NR2]|uniref:PaaX family transcriptional regulator n=1 Tax=Citricoccus sp. NR2 TaxID=3004095 RepID=UPI0022DE70A8|nr:PaaX family transcriptional regulator C-terminal domain-containing protein [Citricoccus sp. NR2]WBL19564.1 phenylacetic acid-responsive transcriptional repressor [Citricoccus sp. NR2]